MPRWPTEYWLHGPLKFMRFFIMPLDVRDNKEIKKSKKSWAPQKNPQKGLLYVLPIFSRYVPISTISRGFWRRSWSFWAIFRCIYVGQLGIPLSLWLWKWWTIFFLFCENIYLGPFSGFLRSSRLFWAQSRLDFQRNPSNGPRNVNHPHPNLNAPCHIINRLINR